ncbi:hypothetical protein [Oceanimonas baumannii]|uniref:Uncharacterized protein n=1 Tax=Oceanimonas baumannii TaxID=129578 RepID=A0A235C9E6_9GAMM|nr:hypothetical protein [Oceanimonas baumannii]OYD21019.1 hypothetical protein B6S09_17905 [Oceanimonas baumannii]TDW53658.1 hypothetical protein LY04_03612 [Oceanimonas baumannii]
MSKQHKDKDQLQYGLDQPHQAGDSTTFAGGQVSYLAPMPLPTGQPAQDYAHAVGEVNDIYLSFGAGMPTVFGWQLPVSTYIGGWVMLLLISPLIAGTVIMMVGGGVSGFGEAALAVFKEGARLGVPIMSLMLIIIASSIYSHHRKYERVIPTRFNRQRREVCFVLEGQKEPLFVPWESLSAWVVEAQGVTQYGVQRQYAMGVGFHHADSGENYTQEFVCGGLPLAIANWEAIRAYMDYEVHSLKEIQDPLDLQGPDDPPHEGLHTFYNARARMRRRYREGEVGKWYVAGWYAYHLFTLWTLPFHLTEWETARVKRIQKHDIPDEMKAWSQPLPAEQWAQPSAELQRQRERLTILRELYPQHSVFSLFTKARGTDELMVPKRKGKKGKKAKAG